MRCSLVCLFFFSFFHVYTSCRQIWMNIPGSINGTQTMQAIRYRAVPMSGEFAKRDTILLASVFTLITSDLERPN